MNPKPTVVARALARSPYAAGVPLVILGIFSDTHDRVGRPCASAR
jgi:hypothetical protein